MPTDSAKPEIGCLKVSSKSSPASVAGAIAGMIKDGSLVEVQAVGAGAVNQAVKAIAISRGFLSPIGIEIVCVPAFADIVIDGEYRTAIRFGVERRAPRGAGATAVAAPSASAGKGSSPAQASPAAKAAQAPEEGLGTAPLASAPAAAASEPQAVVA